MGYFVQTVLGTFVALVATAHCDYVAPSSHRRPATSYGTPAPAYGAPAPAYGAPSQDGSWKDDERPKSYQFGYAVKDHASGNDFGRHETSDGDTVKGSYRVALPDGRTQVVTYTADWQHGFQAKVTYEGEAFYPDKQTAPATSGYDYTPANSHGNRHQSNKHNSQYNSASSGYNAPSYNHGNSASPSYSNHGNGASPSYSNHGNSASPSYSNHGNSASGNYDSGNYDSGNYDSGSYDSGSYNQGTQGGSSFGDRQVDSYSNFGSSSNYNDYNSRDSSAHSSYNH